MVRPGATKQARWAQNEKPPEEAMLLYKINVPCQVHGPSGVFPRARQTRGAEGAGEEGSRPTPRAAHANPPLTRSLVYRRCPVSAHASETPSPLLLRVLFSVLPSPVDAFEKSVAQTRVDRQNRLQCNFCGRSSPRTQIFIKKYILNSPIPAKDPSLKARRIIKGH